MSELKRCPFCGEKMVPSYKLPKHPNGYLKWMRFHPDNKCILSAFSIDLRETERVGAWNTRKPMENIAERLEEELHLSYKEKERCVCLYPLQFDEAKGYARGIANAIEIVKEEGGMHE